MSEPAVPPPPDPSSDPAVPPRAQRRARPTGVARLGWAYVVVAIALAAGAVVGMLGVLPVYACDAEGFGCLGWLVVGLVVGILGAVVTLLVASVRLSLGWVYPVLVAALVAAVWLVPGADDLRWVSVLVPAVAALLTDPGRLVPRRTKPRGTGPRRTGPRGTQPHETGTRSWRLVGAVLLLVLVLVVGGLAAAHEASQVARRSQEIEATGVVPLGPDPDQGWDYALYLAAPVPGLDPTLSWAMSRDGTSVRVEVQPSVSLPDGRPADCNRDGSGSTVCREIAAGVWRVESWAQPTTLVVRNGSTARLSLAQPSAEFGADQLDALAASFRPRTARWLASRASWWRWGAND